MPGMRFARRNLEKLHCALAEGGWTPKPYVDLQIPKPDGGERTIGLSVVEDKIVQNAIKTMIEPLLERTFSSSSYAYRPGRGHQRCVRRAMVELSSDRNGWFFRGDIDNFFDSIDRELLFTRHRLQWNIGNTCATFLRTAEWNSIAE